MGRAIDCKTCLHEKVCDLWLQQERQDASCFCLDGCDYFDPTLTQPNEWVSVEERLPEKHSEYIVCACDEGETIDERIWGDTVVVCADYCDGAFTWYEGNAECDISDIVTHWMPLPAPPAKEGDR